MPLSSLTLASGALPGPHQDPERTRGGTTARNKPQPPGLRSLQPPPASRTRSREAWELTPRTAVRSAPQLRTCYRLGATQKSSLNSDGNHSRLFDTQTSQPQSQPSWSQARGREGEGPREGSGNEERETG